MEMDYCMALFLTGALLCLISISWLSITWRKSLVRCPALEAGAQEGL
jgi:hypothetical protein